MGAYMDKISFQVQGSALEPYTVRFMKNGDNLTAHCTCPAGENGQYCKHRFNILSRSTKGIVSGNLSDVHTVASWLPGSDVEKAMTDVKEAEKAFDTAKKTLSAFKKKLAISMMD